MAIPENIAIATTGSNNIVAMPNNEKNTNVPMVNERTGRIQTSIVKRKNCKFLNKTWPHQHSRQKVQSNISI